MNIYNIRILPQHNVINQIVNIMEVLTFVEIQAFSLQACSENWHLNSI
jgi:hypothetical protein